MGGGSGRLMDTKKRKKIISASRGASASVSDKSNKIESNRGEKRGTSDRKYVEREKS